jgi:hypothetical protein
MNGIITLNGMEKASASKLEFEDLGFPKMKITGIINSPHPFISSSDLVGKNGYNIIGTQYIFSSVAFKRVQVKNDLWYFEAVGSV